MYHKTDYQKLRSILDQFSFEMSVTCSGNNGDNSYNLEHYTKAKTHLKALKKQLKQYKKDHLQD